MTPFAHTEAFWPLIAQPFHTSHLNAWILLRPGGDFQYDTVVSGDFIQAPS